MREVGTFLLMMAIACFACSGTDKAPTTSKIEEALMAIPEISEISQLIQQHPGEAHLRFQRAVLYNDLQKYSHAQEDLIQSIGLDTMQLDAWHLLADTYLDNLQSRKALETMEETVRIFPDSIRSLLKLSEFQLILKRYSEALKTLDRIQKQDSDNADAFFMKGMVFKDAGDTTQAITQFQLATRENPRLIDAWINLGQLHEIKGDENALRYFNAGLTISPNHSLLLHAKAQYLARKGQTELAKSNYKKIIEIDPYSADSYYDLGLLYLDQDSTELAHQHFDITLKLNPVFGRAYFYRGWTNEMMNQIEAARRDYEQVLRIDDGDQDAILALQRIKDKI